MKTEKSDIAFHRNTFLKDILYYNGSSLLVEAQYMARNLTLNIIVFYSPTEIFKYSIWILTSEGPCSQSTLKF